MAIVGIILAIMVGLGFIFAFPSFLGETGSYLGEAFTLFVEKLFLLLAVGLPLITCIVIFYIAVQKEKAEIMLFGSIYAMLLYLLTLYTGIYENISNLFYSSMVGFNMSWYDMFQPAKDFVVATVFLIIGVFNRFVEEIKKFAENLRDVFDKAKKPRKRRGKK